MNTTRPRNQDLRDERSELPEDIQLELEASSKIQLKNKLKQYARETIKFESRKWTQTGTINRVYLPELKKYQVDAAQMVSAIGKRADRLRTAGRGASELYNEIRYIFEEGGNEKTMSTVLEKARRLAVYYLATGKELDRDAKDLSTKALRLPDSLKYLEDDDEDNNKDLFFSPEVIEKIQKTRFEESVIKRSSYSSRSHGGFNGRGRFNEGSFRGRSSGRGSFFGRERGRGAPYPAKINSSSTQEATSGTSQ